MSTMKQELYEVEQSITSSHKQLNNLCNLKEQLDQEAGKNLPQKLKKIGNVLNMQQIHLKQSEIRMKIEQKENEEKQLLITLSNQEESLNEKLKETKVKKIWLQIKLKEYFQTTFLDKSLIMMHKKGAISLLMKLLSVNMSIKDFCFHEFFSTTDKSFMIEFSARIYKIKYQNKWKSIFKSKELNLFNKQIKDINIKQFSKKLNEFKLQTSRQFAKTVVMIGKEYYLNTYNLVVPKKSEKGLLTKPSNIVPGSTKAEFKYLLDLRKKYLNHILDCKNNFANQNQYSLWLNEVLTLVFGEEEKKKILTKMC